MDRGLPGGQEPSSLFLVGEGLGLIPPKALGKQHVSRLKTHVSFFSFLQAPASQKLPGMYLMDSIIKNVRGDYLLAFARNLPLIFPCVFEEVCTLSKSSVISVAFVPGRSYMLSIWAFLVLLPYL